MVECVCSVAKRMCSVAIFVLLLLVVLLVFILVRWLAFSRKSTTCIR